jgi:CSLREA domain-containing protein
VRQALVLAVVLVTASSAWAASLLVDSVTDAPDAAPGNGACATAGSVCTLRAAIQEANALAGADTVSIPPGTYLLAIAGGNEDAGATGDLDVTDDLIVTGAGAASTIIDGGSASRVLHVINGSVVIERLTLQHGDSTGEGDDCGGAVLQQGGDVTLREVVARESTAFAGGGVCQVAGVLLIDASTIASNSASLGGGVLGPYDADASVAITGSTVSANVATGQGAGGIAAGPGTLTITASTVSGNTAPSAITPTGGGGIWGVAGGTIALQNTTVSGNSTSGYGGGILNVAFCSPPPTILCVAGATITLNNVTVANNGAGGVGGGVPGGGVVNGNFGNFTDPDPVLIASNTLLAVNQPQDCGGRVTSASYNLIQNLAGCTVSGDQTGNVTGVDPLLGPLAQNGGPTATHALHGAAVNAGNPAAPGSGSPACEATDQRGVVRPFGSACDIGAYESRCGDATTDPGEDCDDANAVDGDGCDTNCTFTGCGNGIVTAGEQCDGGSSPLADCCSATCQYEPVATACASTVCHGGACNASGQCMQSPQTGTPCDDGIACNGPDTCVNGTCRSGSLCGGMFCNSFACDDGNPCTTGDYCFMGLCMPGPSCDTCTICESDVGCVPASDGASCADDDPCTANETCLAGECTGGTGCGSCASCETGVGCRVPPATCTEAGPGGASLTLKDSSTPARDSVRLRWRSESTIAKADFGDPTAVTSYRLCVFDEDGLLVVGADAPAGGMCGGRPCWKETTSAFAYGDKEQTPHGLKKLQLRGGSHAKIKLQGGGANLTLRQLPLLPPVRARLTRTDTNACWDAGFSTGIRTNNEGAFKARSD